MNLHKRGKKEIIESRYSFPVLFKFQQAKNLFYRIAHILLGIDRLHGIFQGGHLPKNREKGSNSSLIAGGSIGRDGAGKGENGLAVFPGESGNAVGAFPLTV